MYLQIIEMEIFKWYDWVLLSYSKATCVFILELRESDVSPDKNVFSWHKKCWLVFCFTVISHSKPDFKQFNLIMTTICFRQWAENGVIWTYDNKVTLRTRNSIKMNQRGIIKKLNEIELLPVIARSMHTKFGVIWTYGEKVTHRTRESIKHQRVIIQKRNKVELRFLCTTLPVIARSMHTKFGVIWTFGDKVTLRTMESGPQDCRCRK